MNNNNININIKTSLIGTSEDIAACNQLSIKRGIPQASSTLCSGARH
jgi:hypothetical protein